MILITGSTGFIGRALTERLAQEGRDVRALIRPNQSSPDLPKGLAINVGISSLLDERSLRAAMVNVETIFHLVGGEWGGTNIDLGQLEIEGIRNLLKTAKEAGIKRIIYLSHHGADRASGFPVLKVKGIVEEFIRQSDIQFTIYRCGLVFGPNDNFTTKMAEIVSLFKFIPIPGKGETLVHPISIDDLISCLVWGLDISETVNQTYKIGGPEYLSILQILEIVSKSLNLNRVFLPIQPGYLRVVGILLEYLFPNLPLSVYWVDYLASNRTGDLETLPREFGLLPIRLANNIDYLQSKNWKTIARNNLRRKIK